MSTNGNGAESSASNIPTCVGVGYSLIPRMAPERVPVGSRYSSASVPKETRDVASTSFNGRPGQRDLADVPINKSGK